MTPEERQLITGLFDRLNRVADSAVDTEAQGLIDALVAAHPIAPYRMAQLLLMQDRALSAAQEQIRALQQEQAATASSSSPAARDGFLGGIPEHGPWGDTRGATTAPPPPSSPLPTPSAGGGFLRSALQTAAGVAGGALLFEGINSLLHWNDGATGPGNFLPSGPFSDGEASRSIERLVGNECAVPPLADGTAAPFMADDPMTTPLATSDPQPGSTDWLDGNSDNI